MKKTVLMLALLGSLIGCGSGNNSSSGGPLTGQWQITAHSQAFSETSTGNGSIQQNGNSITGNLTLSGSPCATSASLSGSISGLNVTLNINEGGQQVTLTGVVNSAYSSISGNYTAPSGGCTNGDFGTWSASKM